MRRRYGTSPISLSAAVAASLSVTEISSSSFEMLHKLFLNACRQAAPTTNRNHLIQIAFPRYLGRPVLKAQ
jgi:hypothetical protein